MGFRIHRLRAFTLGAVVTAVSIAVPAALVAATLPDARAGDASLASFESRLPPAELADADPDASAFTVALPAEDPGWSAGPAIDTPRVEHTRADPPAMRQLRAVKAPRPRPAYATSSAASGVRALIVQIALAQRNDRYVAGGTGPDTFDCSGLVRYAYAAAGVSGRLGGGHSARAMLEWGRSQGLASRSNPRPGDVVIWGEGSHAGIYIGGGRVISALNARQGIRVTGLHALGASFTAFIHTRA